MPNNIKNRLTFSCGPEKMEEIFNMFNTHVKAEIHKSYDGQAICKSEDGIGWLDLLNGDFHTRNEEFKTVVTGKGLPDGFEIEIEQPYDHFPDFNKIIPQPENIFRGDLGMKEEKECAEKGIPTWYEWNTENWGTKWNCYSCEKIAWNCFKFDTAWSGVPNLIMRMSEKIKDVEIVYIYADEDSGNNTGCMTIKNGDLIDDRSPENGSNEAYELYLKLNPDCDCIKLVNGVYKYIEGK